MSVDNLLAKAREKADAISWVGIDPLTGKPVSYSVAQAPQAARDATARALLEAPTKALEHAAEEIERRELDGVQCVCGWHAAIYLRECAAAYREAAGKENTSGSSDSSSR